MKMSANLPTREALIRPKPCKYYVLTLTPQFVTAQRQTEG